MNVTGLILDAVREATLIGVRVCRLKITALESWMLFCELFRVEPMLSLSQIYDIYRADFVKFRGMLQEGTCQVHGLLIEMR